MGWEVMDKYWQDEYGHICRAAIHQRGVSRIGRLDEVLAAAFPLKCQKIREKGMPNLSKRLCAIPRTGRMSEYGGTRGNLDQM